MVCFCAKKANKIHSDATNADACAAYADGRYTHVDDDHDARTRTRAHALDASVRANDGQERGEPEFDDDVFGVGFASRERRFDDNHGGVSTPVRDE